MKCFCCDADLVVKGKNIMCPVCGITMDAKEHVATVVPKDTNAYVQDSFLCLSFISKYHPDVVIGDVQLFDKNFSIKDVTFFYKDKSNALAYSVPKDTVKVICTKHLFELPEDYTLISMYGYLSFNLRKHLVNTIMSMEDWTGIPLLNWYNVNVFKGFFVLASSLVIEYDAPDTYATDFFDTLSKCCVAVEQLARNDEEALYNICNNNVIEYIKNIKFVRPVTSVKSILQERVKEALSSDVTWTVEDSVNKFTQSALKMYNDSKPCYCGLTNCVFNPLLPEYIDYSYKDLMTKRMHISTDWYAFLSSIVEDKCHYVSMSIEQLRSSYEDFCNKG